MKQGQHNRTYQGDCHCGAIRFSFTRAEIESGMLCNCSICKRRGVVLTAYTVAPSHIDIEASEDALSVYQFGTHTARHYFCNRCGIFTFAQTRLDPCEYRINTGCIKGVDALNLATKIYDGESL